MMRSAGEREVVLSGQQSGGGRCIVLPCTTAAGAVLRISGPGRPAIIRSGSFCNIDGGIAPDVPLLK